MPSEKRCWDRSRGHHHRRRPTTTTTTSPPEEEEDSERPPPPSRWSPRLARWRSRRSVPRSSSVVEMATTISKRDWEEDAQQQQSPPPLTPLVLAKERRRWETTTRRRKARDTRRLACWGRWISTRGQNPWKKNNTRRSRNTPMKKKKFIKPRKSKRWNHKNQKNRSSRRRNRRCNRRCKNKLRHRTC